MKSLKQALQEIKCVICDKELFPPWRGYKYKTKKFIVCKSCKNRYDDTTYKTILRFKGITSNEIV